MSGRYLSIGLIQSAVLLLCCLPSISSLTLTHHATDSTSAPSFPAFFNSTASRTFRSNGAMAAVASIPSTAAVSTPLVSSVTYVSGCARNLGEGTLDCNLTSTLTISGTGFTAPAILEIAYNVNCSLSASAVRSISLIVTPLCPYYYPASQESMWDVRVFTDNTPSAPLTAAISFANTAPIVTSVTTNSCRVPPYNGCDNTVVNTFTMSGRGFLPPPQPRINFVFWLGGDAYLPCFTRVETLTYASYECDTPIFAWGSSPPSPNVRYGGFAFVQDANWLGEQFVSNYVPAVISFNQRASNSSSSSSTGGRVSSSAAPGYGPPVITRVSGCEDSFNNTRNCPYPYADPITITLYGSRFYQYLSSIAVWVGGQQCTNLQYYGRPARLLCSWNTSAVNYAATSTTPLPVAFNSSAGWINVSAAVNVNDAAVLTRPAISSISGCQLYGVATTANCDRSMILTIYGEGFARYLSPSLSIRQHTIRCNFPDSAQSNPLTIECPLREADLSDVPRNVYVFVSLQLGERVSDAVPYVSFAVEGPVPPVLSSSGGSGGVTGDGGGADVDELVGMKLALLSLMIISLIVLVVALAVWVTGWWLAHRRSYVSQYGQAAVDSRQVLLQ